MANKTILLFSAKSASAPKGQRVALGSNDIFGAGREIVWSDPEGLSVGCAQWHGRTASVSFPHTEALVVVGGHLRLSSEGSTFDLSSGGSVVIGRGARITAEAEAGTRWIYCAGTAAMSATPRVVEIARDAPLAPSPPPPAHLVEKETPQCSNFKAFVDEAACFRAGIWTSTPHIRLSRPHPFHELMYIHAGDADVTDSDGTITNIGPGDAIFVPRGTINTLSLHQNIKKVFVIVEIGSSI